MKFSEAEKALKAGKKIKLPKWENAYWYMNQDGELINHFEEGAELPTIALFPRDMIWVTRDDWESYRRLSLKTSTNLRAR